MARRTISSQSGLTKHRVDLSNTYRMIVLVMGLGLGLSLWGSTVGHPSNSWASCNILQQEGKFYSKSINCQLSLCSELRVLLLVKTKVTSKLTQGQSNIPLNRPLMISYSIILAVDRRSRDKHLYFARGRSGPYV